MFRFAQHDKDERYTAYSNENAIRLYLCGLCDLCGKRLVVMLRNPADLDRQCVIAIAVGEAADHGKRLAGLLQLILDNLAGEDKRLVSDVDVVEEAEQPLHHRADTSDDCADPGGHAT